MNIDQIAAECFDKLIQSKWEDAHAIIKSTIEKATKEVQEERDYYESRRGGECQNCDSWICPPLTCMSCLAGLDLKDELRKTNQELTEKLESRAAHASEPWTVINAAVSQTKEGEWTLLLTFRNLIRSDYTR